MSLLAMIAANFELEEQPLIDNNEFTDTAMTMDINVTLATAPHTSSKIDDNGDDFGGISNCSSNSADHNDILKQQLRNNSEGTAETEQSLDSTTNNYTAVSNDHRHDNATVNRGDFVDNSSSSRRERKLLITFFLMVVVGTGMKIFQKLQAIPMYNYPNSLNLIQNFVYVPLCFMYIIPVSRLGLFNNSIPNEVTLLNKRPFVVMGLFDCITCMLLTFSAVYLPGSLLILLPQAAIPISMFFSKRLKGEKYAMYQYLGALVVIIGILVVLEPLISQRRHAVDEFVCVAYNDEYCAQCGEESREDACLSHRVKTIMPMEKMEWSSKAAEREHIIVNYLSAGPSPNNAADDHDGALCQWVSSSSSSPTTQPSPSSESTSTLLIWSIVTILSCIPMTLSSIYKEIALSGSTTHIDPIFLNGWVAWFQFLFSFPLSIPAGMATGISPSALPANIWDGIKCYLGVSTITSGCHPDDLCGESPLYVNIFLLFNVAFNILLVFVLKFGSANVLFLAATIMVPIGNLAFALPFMPGSMPLHDSDIAGLLVILLGLVTYRFGGSVIKCRSIIRKVYSRSDDDKSNNYEGNLFSPGTILPFSPAGVRRYARKLLNTGNYEREEFEWNTPYEEDVESDFKGLRMPRSLIGDLEEPLLSPVES